VKVLFAAALVAALVFASINIGAMAAPGAVEVYTEDGGSAPQAPTEPEKPAAPQAPAEASAPAEATPATATSPAPAPGTEVTAPDPDWPGSGTPPVTTTSPAKRPSAALAPSSGNTGVTAGGKRYDKRRYAERRRHAWRGSSRHQSAGQRFGASIASIRQMVRVEVARWAAKFELRLNALSQSVSRLKDRVASLEQANRNRKREIGRLQFNDKALDDRVRLLEAETGRPSPPAGRYDLPAVVVPAPGTPTPGTPGAAPAPGAPAPGAGAPPASPDSGSGRTIWEWLWGIFKLGLGFLLAASIAYGISEWVMGIGRIPRWVRILIVVGVVIFALAVLNVLWWPDARFFFFG
jgi:hypothetical protein